MGNFPIRSLNSYLVKGENMRVFLSTTAFPAARNKDVDCVGSFLPNSVASRTPTIACKSEAFERPALPPLSSDRLQLSAERRDRRGVSKFAMSGYSRALLAVLILAGFLTSSVSLSQATTATAAPVFPLTSAVYYSAQTVTITDATPGAVIYYTTNGTTPTTQSTVYRGPISLNTPGSLNFEAVAIAPGDSLSSVTKAWYTINLTTATPVISLAAGAYGTPQTISITDSTPGAVIYYTTTGKYPTTSSPVYSGSFVISSDTIVEAIALAPTYMTGSAASATYTIAAPTPSISPAPGTYTTVQTVTLSTTTPGAFLHYTTNGSTPTSSSTYYSGPFTVSANATVQAISSATNYNQSAIASATYTIVLPTAAPTMSPAAGTYVNNQTVTIKDSNTSAVIYFTLNGSTPTTSSSVYSGPLTVSANETVSAMALAPGSSNSPVSQAVYTITPPAAAPVFPVASGNYTSVQTVTITDATPGATIYYTTNATAPTAQSSKYTGPITIGAAQSVNIWAAALAPGGSLSPVTKAWYDIVLPTPAPVASVPGGTYSSVPHVVLTDAAPGATIYYTIDGTYPTTSSPVYSGPIPAPNGTQINAIATAPSYSLGSMFMGVYTVIAPPPSITPPSGTLNNTATVTITDAIAGATIYYTSDGSIPSTSSPVYYSPIKLSPQRTTNEVFQAMAIAPGCLQSSSTTATFTIDLPEGVLAKASVASTPVLTIPLGFLGLSGDWHQPPLMMGQASTGTNQIFRTMVNNLIVNSKAPLNYRITGDDSVVANIQAAAEPLEELSLAVNLKYDLGVDLWNSNVSIAQAEVSVWLSGIQNKSIQAFEIGNEPDVYPVNGARPSTYSFAQYLPQYQQWAAAVNSTDGNGFGIMGPSMGGETNWIPASEAAIAAGTLNPSIVGQHAYLGDVIQPSGAPWPVDYLLQPASATEFPQLLKPFAASAHSAGHLFRVSEMNSFYNGGVLGISNTFSSALWSIDTMFNFVNTGMDGVNWHSGQGAPYQIYDFHSSTVNGLTTFNLAQVNPLYYGLLIFSEMVGNNAKLLPVTTTTSSNVSIWATVDSTTKAHVVVINKDESAAGSVQITMPGYSSGTVRYLTAADYSAINGVTFGGQTFDGSQDGTIQGSLISTTITPVGGVFTIPNMAITSAALIDFSH
jgi:hypothetical protein